MILGNSANVGRDNVGVAIRIYWFLGRDNVRRMQGGGYDQVRGRCGRLAFGNNNSKVNARMPRQPDGQVQTVLEYSIDT